MTHCISYFEKYVGFYLQVMPFKTYIYSITQSTLLVWNAISQADPRERSAHFLEYASQIPHVPAGNWGDFQQN